MTAVTTRHPAVTAPTGDLSPEVAGNQRNKHLARQYDEKTIAILQQRIVEHYEAAGLQGILALMEQIEENAGAAGRVADLFENKPAYLASLSMSFRGAVDLIDRDEAEAALSPLGLGFSSSLDEFKPKAKAKAARKPAKAKK